MIKGMAGEKKNNYIDRLGDEFFKSIESEDFNFLLSQDYVIQSDPINYQNISEELLRDIFEENPFIQSHQRAIVLKFGIQDLQLLMSNLILKLFNGMIVILGLENF